MCAYDKKRLAQPLPASITSARDVPKFLADRDAAAGPLQPDAQSSVQWAGATGEQTDLCVLFIHGWSSSPREISPVDSRVAQSLRANHVRIRLTGHGLAPLERAGRMMVGHAPPSLALPLWGPTAAW